MQDSILCTFDYRVLLGSPLNYILIVINPILPPMPFLFKFHYSIYPPPYTCISKIYPFMYPYNNLYLDHISQIRLQSTLCTHLTIINLIFLIMFDEE